MKPIEITLWIPTRKGPRRTTALEGLRAASNAIGGVTRTDVVEGKGGAWATVSAYTVATPKEGL